MSEVMEATDSDPISACCAGNTGGAQHEGCAYEGCRCSCHIEAAYDEPYTPDEERGGTVRFPPQEQ